MKKVLIDNLKGGEILAQEVWDDNGTQWLSEGTTYKTSYLDKLVSLDVEYIYIKEGETADNFIIKRDFNPEILRGKSKEVIDRQLLRFKKNGSINVYKFEKLVFDITSEMMQSNKIIENIYNMKSYDNYTYEHSLNVTVIAIMISKQMELSKYDIYENAMGCILHDLGKVEISQKILSKPATLTRDEFNEIKKHSINGYNIVKDNRHLSKEIKEIILTHHEKLDGSGYPLGISGDQISLGSRVCSIADVFDAMCSERPYKVAVPFAESIRSMTTCMHKQLDMEICKVLENILK